MSLFLYASYQKASLSVEAGKTFGEIWIFLVQYTVNSVFSTADSLFTDFVGVFLLAFFLAKALFYFATKNPNKYAILVDLTVFAFLYGMHTSIGDAASDQGTGFKLAYIAVLGWFIWMNFRKVFFAR